MAITFHIPGPLRSLADDHAVVRMDASPADLREALELLWASYPGLRDRILNEEGQIREHVNVFVGSESVRHTGGLATALPPRVEISIIPAISGG